MGTSLIPIKGISQSLKNSLKSKCNISDIAGLLEFGAAAEKYSTSTRDPIPMFDDYPEPTHLFEGGNIDFWGSRYNMGGITKITVTVTFANGQTYENTTTFPAIPGGFMGAFDDAAGSDNTESNSGRVDHPAGKGTYTESSTGTTQSGRTGRRR